MSMDTEIMKDEKAIGRKAFLAEGIMASSEAHTFMGNLLTAFALAIGSNERQIGMLNTARNFAGFTQLFANHLLQRIGSKRRLFFYTVGMSRIFRVIVAFLPSVPFIFIQNNAGWWLIILMFIVGCGDSITIVLRKTWMSEITPSEIRGRYFGLRNLTSESSGMIIGYLGGIYIDYQKRSGNEIFGFQSIFLFSALIGFLTLIIITRVPEAKSSPKKQDLKAFLGSFKLPFKDRSFLMWIIFNSCYNFGIGFAGPFFTVYLLKELNLSLATVAIYTAIGELSSIVLARLWGSLADKYGSIKVLMLACIVKAVFPALWVFTTGASNVWAILWLGFVHSLRGFNSAQGITALNMSLGLSPEKDRPIYIACESTIVNIASAISPFLGGIMLESIGSRHADFSILNRQFSLCGLHILFLISAILRGLALPLLFLLKSNMAKDNKT